MLPLTSVRACCGTVVLGNHYPLDDPGTMALRHSVLIHIVCSWSSLPMALVCVLSIGVFGGWGGSVGGRVHEQFCPSDCLRFWMKVNNSFHMALCEAHTSPLNVLILCRRQFRVCIAVRWIAEPHLSLGLYLQRPLLQMYMCCCLCASC